MTHRFSDAAAEDCWRTCYPLQAPEEQQDPQILDSQVRSYSGDGEYCMLRFSCLQEGTTELVTTVWVERVT